MYVDGQTHHKKIDQSQHRYTESNDLIVKAQNKEGILPVATPSIALYVLRRFMSSSEVAPEVVILSSAS